jgi:hypothetical protein
MCPERLEIAKQRVREIAYLLWLDEGCPEGEDLRHWCTAEKKWIEYEFVPDRNSEPIQFSDAKTPSLDPENQLVSAT